MIDVDLTKHTGVADESNVGTDTAVERRGYESLRHYWRWLDRRDKRHLEGQRDILKAILFEPAARELLQCLTPTDFTERRYYDWQYPKGIIELLADIAFAYWDQHGEPPRERIYDLVLVADMPEITFGIVKRMEREQREWEAKRARIKARYERWVDEDGEFECVGEEYYTPSPPDDDSWLAGLRARIEAYHRPVQPMQRQESRSAPRRVSRAEKRISRQQRAAEMLRDGKSRKEIIEATGYTAGRISQIAGEMEDVKKDETV
jgi:hypothetical protein